MAKRGPAAVPVVVSVCGGAPGLCYPGPCMPEHILLADIGGTNARFAVVRGGSLNLEHLHKLKGHDYASIDAAIAEYLRRLPDDLDTPRNACLAIAAPIEGERVTMTNLAWSFSIDTLRDSLSLDQLLVINDFKAVARSIPELAADRLQAIGGGSLKKGAPAVVLGPGTGLGVSALVFAGDKPTAIQTEGGHIGFAPSDRVEMQILERLWEKYDRVSVERLLSGPGLVNLYESLAAINKRSIEPLQPEAVTQRALSGECQDCKEALNRFFGILGSVAGDLALAVGAEGGVYIAGGILPRMLDEFRHSDFRARFESKGRFSQYVSAMATIVVCEPYPGLIGSAALFNDVHG